MGLAGYTGAADLAAQPWPRKKDEEGDRIEKQLLGKHRANHGLPS